MEKKLTENHLLQVDVMKKVATVRVVKDQRHREPGMQGNQGDELKAMRCYLINLISEMAVVALFWIHVFLPWSLGSCRPTLETSLGSTLCDAMCAARKRRQRKSMCVRPISTPYNKKSMSLGERDKYLELDELTCL